MIAPALDFTPHFDALSAPLWVQVASHLDPKYGGLSSALPKLGKALEETGCCKIGIASFSHPLEQRLSPGLAEDQVTFWPSSRRNWIGKELRNRFQDSLVDAQGVHIHGLWEQSSLAARKAAEALKKPYVISAHGMLEPWALANSRWKKIIYAALIEREVIRGASCLHALTVAEAENYRSFGMKQPIAIIPNGVELPAKFDVNLFFETYPELKGKRIVLSLSRLHRKKGIDLLVEAWAKCGIAQDAHLVIAGPDSDGTLAQLKARVAELSIADHVTFTGLLTGDMKWSALSSASCFILPSHSEGLSVALLEAMGMGIPVIASHQCNMPQVGEHDLGWLIEPNVAEISAALKAFSHSSETVLADKSQRARQLVATQYSWQQAATQMAEVYEWVSGGTKPHLCEVIL